jgi:hypothetical protein
MSQNPSSLLLPVSLLPSPSPHNHPSQLIISFFFFSSSTVATGSTAVKSVSAVSSAVSGGDVATKVALEESQKKVASLRLMIDTLEKERNFYYSRLREVELLCQTYEDQSLPFRNQVLAILYKTDESSASASSAATSSDVASQATTQLLVDPVQ